MIVLHKILLAAAHLFFSQLLQVGLSGKTAENPSTSSYDWRLN